MCAQTRPKTKQTRNKFRFPGKNVSKMVFTAQIRAYYAKCNSDFHENWKISLPYSVNKYRAAFNCPLCWSFFFFFIPSYMHRILWTVGNCVFEIRFNVIWHFLRYTQLNYSLIFISLDHKLHKKCDQVKKKKEPQELSNGYEI